MPAGTRGPKLGGVTTHPAFEQTLPIVPADIDENGHVNNVVYLRWVQEIAVAHWRARASAEDQARIGWVVLKHEIEYRHPALLADAGVVARTWVGTATAATYERHTEIFRAADRKPLARATSVWCVVDPASGRPRRIDPAMRARFEGDAG